jgi:hypothetical protein
MSITPQEIEAFALRMAVPGFEATEALIGHLYGADVLAVLSRTAEIAREAAEVAEREADSQEALVRLARAAGCPEDVGMISWLEERGLIEPVDGGWRFKTPKPGSAATSSTT